MWSDASLGGVTWRTGCCPCSVSSLSTSLMGPKERLSRYSLGPAPSQELPGRGCTQRRTALGAPTPDFSSRFTPEAFSTTGYGRKAAGVWNQGCLPLDGLLSWADVLHLPDATGFKAPGSRLSALLLSVKAVPRRARQELDLVVRGYLRRTPLGAFYCQWELIPTLTPGYDNLGTNR